MILSKDEDLGRVKTALRSDDEFGNLIFTKWEKSQPLGSIRGTLYTMWFDNTTDEIAKFIKKHKIKIANPSNFNL